MSGHMFEVGKRTHKMAQESLAVQARPREVDAAAAPFTGAEITMILTCKGVAMKLPRRTFLYFAASAAALPAVSRIASAQTYPTRERRTKVAV
jgi:hypothetical protein